jgi:hypothetical protein
LADRVSPTSGPVGLTLPQFGISDFSRPAGGTYYFARSVNTINELTGPERD